MTALPFGATPDDTGEFMLGDVHVTVVLMESNNAIDNGTITYESATDPPAEVINYTPENWTPAAIQSVKDRVEEGVNWWKETLDAMPTVRDGLLNFTFDWTHLFAPVQTAFEPIARRSNDFTKWIPSFLTPALAAAGLPSSGSISADIRRFNNFQRQQNDADWAFTIFVVNNANDLAEDVQEGVRPRDQGTFATTGQFRNAFSFAGGRFMVVPASRPASTYAHEAGHMFWALDEYSGGGTHDSSRGYYNTPNTNAWDNPETGFEQQPSIMDRDVPDPDPPDLPSFLLTQAYNTNTSSQSSLQMIGWRDSDADGLFDVLDVPFELTGTGRVDPGTGAYLFTGSSAVRTLPNLNPTFLQNDITINRIREVQYSVDNGPWQVAQSFPDRTYKTNLDLSIVNSALQSPGTHTIKIRTIDTRTGAMSPEFVGTVSPTSTPQSVPSSDAGASGFTWFDADGDGSWDRNEAPLVDWAIQFVDQFGTPVTLQRVIDPDDYLGQILNSVHPEAVLSVVGGDASRNEVQELTILPQTGATVTPSFGGVPGTPLVLDFPLTPGELLASLSEIPALDNNILVSFGNGPGKFLVTFTGGLAGTDVSLIVQGGSTNGGTLSSQTVLESISPNVHSRVGPNASPKPYVYANYSVSQGAFSTVWNTSRQFKAEFSSPVSSVSIRALFGGTSPGVARLEAYSAAGVLLERYTSGVLTSGKTELLSIARPTPDIAYVIAYGHLGSEVGLENLTWGPRSSATTNLLGAWSVASLLTGTYHVKVLPPGGHIVTTPQSGQYTVNYVAGQAMGDLNFGIFNTDNIWHNIAKPENVNADSAGLVNSIDLLMVINWLTINGVGTPLPPTGDPTISGYVDVDGNTQCNVLDVLALVNYITLHPPVGGGGGGGGGGEGETGGGAALSGGSGAGAPGGEGEEPMLGGAGDLSSFGLSLSYLESREDIHVHLDGDGHHHGDHDADHGELLDSLSPDSNVSSIASLGAELDPLAVFVDEAAPQLPSSESADDFLAAIAASDDGWLDRVARLPLASDADDEKDGLVPLAQRKRLDQAIDAIAGDVNMDADVKLARRLARNVRPASR